MRVRSGHAYRVPGISFHNSIGVVCKCSVMMVVVFLNSSLNIKISQKPMTTEEFGQLLLSAVQGVALPKVCILSTSTDCVEIS